ncbi:MAG: AAA-like domain-containing protein [Scytonematopsis contorta HA4267-MV1]|jgi:WD40 repeat protein|nr:AAA-like domain-containing protein [Scytonematopsis contorta HA4267-MV1]
MSNYTYQFGGSLAFDAPSYVKRSCDSQLYEALKQGELCYVFNSRQMGKSSLLVSTKHRLEQEGFKCVAIDMSIIGISNITPLQWYKSVVTDLWSSFNLFKKVDLQSWWRQQQQDISLLSKLRWFIEELLLVHFPQERLFIFIDEIDSILGLDFSVDDFFALIRFCYNQRTINPEYKRVTFALFGVATPSDLIRDKTITSFNIGQSIALNGFTIDEMTPLIKGLEKVIESPKSIIKEILSWTKGQPFLTQKICYLISKLNTNHAHTKKRIIPTDGEKKWVENLIKKYFINYWESQDEPEHLRTIRDRIERNGQRAGRMLGIYQQILQAQNPKFDDSREHIELLLSGLVVKEQGLLYVKNRIYEEVFNLSWVEQQLAFLRPYSQTLDAWVASNQIDKSRLLRGQALKDAQIWAQGKSLNDLDYQFLARSEELDRQEAEIRFSAERAQEVAARLKQEERALRLQQLWLGAVTTALREAQINEIKAIAKTSDALFASNQRLDALVQAIKAKRRLQKLGAVNLKSESEISEQVEAVLRQAVYGAVECNRLSGHFGEVWEVAITQDSNIIASASYNHEIKLWRRDGKLLKTLKLETASVWGLVFSPDGQILASGGEDGTIKLWRRLSTTEFETYPHQKFKAHKGAIRAIAFSPDGEIIVSAGDDVTLKIWKRDYTGYCSLPKAILKGHDAFVSCIAFSPDGQMFASNSESTMKLWQRNGTLINTWQAHDAGISQFVFTPNGQTLITASLDKTIKYWNINDLMATPQPQKIFQASSVGVASLIISSDGSIIISGSYDKTIKIWDIDGAELVTLRGASGAVQRLALSPDNSYLVSATTERIVRVWKFHNEINKIITAHNAPIWNVAISGESSIIATASLDYTVKLWSREGKLLKTLIGHDASIFSIALNQDTQTIATASNDSTVRLWSWDGILLHTLNGHSTLVWDVAFSPDNETIVSVGADNTIIFWNQNGTLQKTLTSYGSTMRRIAFSSDGSIFVVASGESSIELWTCDGILLNTLTEHKSLVCKVAFSPDNQTFASGSTDGTVNLWRRDGLLIKTISAHSGAVCGLAFTPDAHIIVTGGGDKMVKLWKLDGTLLETLSGHSSAVRAVAVSPDGSYITSVGEDNNLIIWNLPHVLNLNLLEYACNLVRDYLQTNLEVEEEDRELLCEGLVCKGITPVTERKF